MKGGHGHFIRSHRNLDKSEEDSGTANIAKHLCSRNYASN